MAPIATVPMTKLSFYLPLMLSMVQEKPPTNNSAPMAATHTHKKHHWTYKGIQGPESWVAEFPVCGGKQQSPVDIVPRTCQYDPALDDFRLGNFHSVSTTASVGQGSVLCNFTNNGHSASVRVTGDMLVEGGGLPGQFRTAGFHFHWGSHSGLGSEHAIDGVKYPLEMHIVNYATKYGSVKNAADKPYGLAVLGVMFQISDHDNPDFQPFAATVQFIHKSGEFRLLDGVRLRSLLPADTSKYYRYAGSLTTPGCFESVTWTVFADPLKVSERQLAGLRDLEHEDGHFSADLDPTQNVPNRLVDNWRPLQPLHGRVVRQSFPVTAVSPSATARETTSSAATSRATTTTPAPSRTATTSKVQITLSPQQEMTSAPTYDATPLPEQTLPTKFIFDSIDNLVPTSFVDSVPPFQRLTGANDVYGQDVVMSPASRLPDSQHQHGGSLDIFGYPSIITSDPGTSFPDPTVMGGPYRSGISDQPALNVVGDTSNSFFPAVRENVPLAAPGSSSASQPDPFPPDTSRTIRGPAPSAPPTPTPAAAVTISMPAESASGRSQSSLGPSPVPATIPPQSASSREQLLGLMYRLVELLKVKGHVLSHQTPAGGAGDGGTQPGDERLGQLQQDLQYTINRATTVQAAQPATGDVFNDNTMSEPLREEPASSVVKPGLNLRSGGGLASASEASAAGLNVSDATQAGVPPRQQRPTSAKSPPTFLDAVKSFESTVYQGARQPNPAFTVYQGARQPNPAFRNVITSGAAAVPSPRQSPPRDVQSTWEDQHMSRPWGELLNTNPSPERLASSRAQPANVPSTLHSALPAPRLGSLYTPPVQRLESGYTPPVQRLESGYTPPGPRRVAPGVVQPVLGRLDTALVRLPPSRAHTVRPTEPEAFFNLLLTSLTLPRHPETLQRQATPQHQQQPQQQQTPRQQQQPQAIQPYGQVIQPYGQVIQPYGQVIQPYRRVLGRRMQVIPAEGVTRNSPYVFLYRSTEPMRLYTFYFNKVYQRQQP